MTTRIAQMLRIIAQKPGIRSVDLADLINIYAELVRPTLKTHIERGEVRFEKVQAPNGRWINTYFMADGYTPAQVNKGTQAPKEDGDDRRDDEIEEPKQRTVSWPPDQSKKAIPVKKVRASTPRSSNNIAAESQPRLLTVIPDVAELADTLEIGIFSTGELIIQGHGVNLRLTPENTKKLSDFLGQVHHIHTTLRARVNP